MTAPAPSTWWRRRRAVAFRALARTGTMILCAALAGGLLIPWLLIRVGGFRLTLAAGAGLLFIVSLRIRTDDFYRGRD